MLPPVFRTLKAADPVTAIVQARIWRHGDAEQGPPVDLVNERRPYITWFVAGAAPANQLSGTPGADLMPVQLDLWHPTDKGIEELGTAVRDAIEPYAHWTGLVADQRDKESGLFRLSLQFDWWRLR
jgi:hypothetical protein